MPRPFTPREDTRTVQQRDQDHRDTLRLIGLFGQRETELAALRILDSQWGEPYRQVDPSIFRDDDEREGWANLQAWGWVEGGVPSLAFWLKVHGR